MSAPDNPRISNPFRHVILLTGLLVGWTNASFSQIPLTEQIAVYGDIRTGYFGTFRDERDATQLERNEWRTRIRLGLHYALTEKWNIRVRYAARLSNEQDEFRLHHSTTDLRNNGLRIGQGGFDEAYVSYRQGSQTWRAGRFQTGFTLPGVIGNAIIRSDSPNNDVQWTNGLWLSHTIDAQWQADLIAQSNYGNWPSNTLRRPMDFDKKLPWGLFGSIRRVSKERIRLQQVQTTVFPNALHPVAQSRSTLALVSASMVLGWDFPRERTILTGVEVGRSLNNLTREAMRLSGDLSEESGGWGFQANASVYNIIPDHHIGIVTGVMQPMMLTSEDYWDNGWMYEIRHQYIANRRLSFESRLRWRGDAIRRQGAQARRVEMVPYVRLTYRLR